MKQTDSFFYKGYTFIRTNGMWTAEKPGEKKIGPSMYRNDLKEIVDIKEKNNKTN